MPKMTNLDWIRSLSPAGLRKAFGLDGTICDMVSWSCDDCGGDCERCIDAWFSAEHVGCVDECHARLVRRPSHTEYDVLWVSTSMWPTVGIVKVWDENEGGWHFYIGPAIGRDPDEDVQYIIDLGAKFLDLDFIAAFADAKPPQHREGPEDGEASS